MTVRVGIIGCGLIGRKRADALSGIGDVIACADTNLQRAEALAIQHGATVHRNWNELLKSPDLDVVIVATTHDSLAAITLAAIESGKHVFVEKPAARNADELHPVIAAAESRGACVHVGFNHRHHRALQKAKDLVAANAIGDLMFIRARYGHGGRVGYDKEWRANPEVSGGGELIDQGPHLIDLARWFLGDFTEVSGFAHTYFWNMPVDDNAFMLLKTAARRAAFLHVSCTEWKNLFSMEVYGRDGKIEISGLGGSYGVERITLYRMLPEMGPPETIAWEYPMPDNSWSVEMRDFITRLEQGKQPSSTLRDAYATLDVIQKIYAGDER